MAFRRAVALLFGASALLLGFGAHRASAATTWTVDDDHVQCPEAQFSSIQAAVDAAAPGDTVQVCPGVYNEKVTVTKPLTLVGPGVGADPGTSAYCSVPARIDPTKQAIIESGGGTGVSIVVDLAADGDSFSGFVVRSAPLTTAGVGIETGGLASGFQITGNVIQNTSNNVFVNTSGANETDVRDNCLRTNIPTSSPSLYGIVFNGAHNARIEGNATYRNSGAGINFQRSTGSDVVIDNNSSLLDGRFIVVNRALGGAIVGNTATNSLRDAIELHILNTNLLVGGNTLTAGLTGVDVTGTSNSSNAFVGNRISNMRGSGIVVQAVGALQSSFIDQNTVTDSGHNGIELHATATQNELRGNTALGSGLYDCYDDSTGTGKAGTANSWINDTGQTENRHGLCHH